MAVTVRTRLHDGTTFITLDGLGDAGVLACIGDAVADALVDGPVVLDLTDLVLISPSAVTALVDRLRVPGLDGCLRVVSPRIRGIGGAPIPHVTA
jgi:hypothetical protein